MKTEELAQDKREDSLHFDAHEFDGLRELEHEAQNILARVEQFVRKNPLLSVAIAAAAGFLIGGAARKTLGRGEPEE